MNYYYIHKFLSNVIESKLTRCKYCNRIILKNPIQYKFSQLCSFKCLTEHFEEVYIRRKIEK
jgi:hypothetical protein